jgi:hypothetical protein
LTVDSIVFCICIFKQEYVAAAVGIRQNGHWTASGFARIREEQKQTLFKLAQRQGAGLQDDRP